MILLILSCCCFCPLLFSFFFTCFVLLSSFFFFSSRRRHTRCLSDWSSDVCSSDLLLVKGAGLGPALLRVLLLGLGQQPLCALALGAARQSRLPVVQVERIDLGTRSEERRVGKEGRSRVSR